MDTPLSVQVSFVVNRLMGVGVGGGGGGGEGHWHDSERSEPFGTLSIVESLSDDIRFFCLHSKTMQHFLYVATKMLAYVRAVPYMEVRVLHICMYIMVCIINFVVHYTNRNKPKLIHPTMGETTMYTYYTAYYLSTL